jgi:arylsulfatase A-like enzyme
MSVASRLLSTWIAAVCVTVAYHSGGGADDPAEPPRAPSHEDASPPLTKGAATGFEVETRLLDALKDARFDAKNLRPGLAALDGHWRKMRAPWIDFTGSAARAAQSFAVLTSQSEDEAVIPIGSGEVWKPDAKKWNMSEGSFDERDAIFAPTPSRIAYDLTIPPDARLTFSMAVENAAAPTTFAVTVKDARGAVREIFSQKVPAHSTKKWLDAKVDLSDLAGQAVELSLSTSMEPPPGRPEAFSLALWGDPLVVASTKTRVPYNVLWIVIDALRADAVQSFRDDADDTAKRSARFPPLGALLPKVPGLTPNLDALAARGVRFIHAYSAATWTRPGTVGMLGGARSPELGLDSLRWQLPDEEASRFYASDLPLLPLLLRRQGAEAVGFVNNYFMVGYAAVGADLGFQRIADYRYRTLDTREITTNTLDWLEHHKDDRFFLFCNYNSPHEPLDPPPRFRSKVPPPPAGPTDDMAARYLGEVGKDDEAVGQLMQALDDLKLRDKTLVVVTADHAETLSEAHDGITALDHMKVRYHHSQGNFEETTHIPVLLSLPGKLPEGKVVKARARNIDLAPTVLDLEGMDPSPKMTGASLVPLVRGETEPSERVVVIDGRGTRAILVDNYRFVVRDPVAQKTIYPDKEVVIPEELYDLASDPGERHNLAKSMPDKVAEMRARLEAAQKNAPVTGALKNAPTAASAAGGAPGSPTGPSAGASPHAVSLRFAGGGSPHRVSGAIFTDGAALHVIPVGLAAEVVRARDTRVEIAFTTPKDAVAGLDLEIAPAAASVHWELFLDDEPWPADRVYGGAFGLSAPALRGGIVSEQARTAAFGAEPPFVDPARDFGLFVTRESSREPEAFERGKGGAGDEMRRLMREWGYAHGPAQGTGGSQ